MCRVRDVGCGVGCRVRILSAGLCEEVVIQDDGLRLQGVGCTVEGSGFEKRDLLCRV